MGRIVELFASLSDAFKPEVRGKRRVLLPDRWDFSLFAAEDEGRTVEPTPYRIREALREGRIPKTRYLSPPLVIVFSVLYLVLAGKQIVALISSSFYEISSYIGNVARSDFQVSYAVGLIYYSLMLLAKVVLPIALIAFLTSAMVNLMQARFIITFRTLKFDFSNISRTASQFFKNLVTPKEALYRLGGSLLRVVIVSVASVLVLRMYLPDFVHLYNLSPIGILFFVGKVAVHLIMVFAIVWLAYAGADYFYNYRKWRESLKMTPRELREELKAHGEPEASPVKQRIREMFREMVESASVIEREVPKATLVVANPVHYAVAIRLGKIEDETGEMVTAAKVVAKGMGKMAIYIKKVASENGVPVVERPQVARELYFKSKVGDLIPEELYQAVISILVMLVNRGTLNREKVLNPEPM